MKKWIKRLLLLLATIIVVLIGGGLVAYFLARAEPSFYRPRQLSPQERATAAQSAEEKFIQIQNSAARMNAAAQPRAVHTTGPFVLDDRPVTISFTDAELNSFFEKWSNFQNWKSSYETYLTDPVIILRDGRLILAAKMRDPDLVISLHLEPKINATGQLELELVRILGGRLPLPEAMIAKYERRAADSLAIRLPAWQNTARIDSGGIANSGAISASMTKLLIDVFRHEPAEPVLYLPVFGQRGSVPVRIIDVKVEDGLITLTVRPLDHAEQVALLQRIRQSEPLAIDAPRPAR